MFWVTPLGVEVPWVGIDKNACNYMDPPCGGEDTEGAEVVKYRFPIDCLKVYPRVSDILSKVCEWDNPPRVSQVHIFLWYCRGISS